ncbi:MAG: hypothetical protein ACYSWX_09495 [Planctomycetota bacterium]|jgi:hypothetical protein
MSDTETQPASAATPPKDLPDLPEGAALLKEGRIPYIPKERKLEEAPLMLGKAAWILLAGSALPWYGHGGTWITWGLAKAVVLLSCFFFYCSVVARTDQPVPAGLGALGKLRWGPPYGTKAKKPHEQILAFVPTPLHLLGLLLMVGGMLVPSYDEGVDSLKAMVEVGSLFLAGATLVHIFAYKKGGNFNPLFPLLFLGPALSGLLIFFQTLGGGAIFSAENAPKLLGSLLSLGAGAFGVYTMALAMMQAKKEGDAKKAAAAEARKAARAARKSQSKG